MRFWISRLVLLFVLVIGPVGTALWLDVDTEVDRARVAGVRDARRAAASLSARVALRVREQVDAALTVAHALEDAEVLAALDDPKSESSEALKLAEARLADVRPSGGFAWLVDELGRVRAGMRGVDPEAKPRSVARHPLFVESQMGFAADRLWRRDALVLWGAAAPLVVQGRAAGGVIVGWPIDELFVSELASSLDVDLTLVRDGEAVFSSLERPVATEVAERALRLAQPVLAGRLPAPLPSPVPGLPLLIGSRAEGLAYTSLAVDVPGPNLDWVVSVPATAPLEALALRQVNLLAGGVALAMFLLLFAVIDHRSYVKPIDLMSDHLSEIQLGRGDLEMSELVVSKPVRRLVRLVNMTVQKLPPRGLSNLTGGTASLGTAPRVSSTPAPPPPSGSAVGSSSLRLDEVLADPPSDARPASPPSPQAPDSAIAEAIASLDSAPSTELDGSSEERPGRSRRGSTLVPVKMPPARKSASAIRGGTPAPKLIDGDDPFYEVSQFTLRPQALSRKQSGGVRGGGSLDLGSGAGISDRPSQRPAASTVVAPVAEELLAKSARDDSGPGLEAEADNKQEMTVVATVDPELLSKTLGGDGLQDADVAHFKMVYDEFLAMRRKCGEQTKDLAFDRFRAKLEKNRAKLITKYNCKTVRFQVYQKEGKAALKATPVRSR